MNTLIAVGYDDPYKAEEIHVKLRKMHKGDLIELEDAVFATKDAAGRVGLHQPMRLTAFGAISGGFLGTLVGVMFLNPILGAAVGVAAGAARGAILDVLIDVGLNDKFMKDLAATLKPGSSALFVLVSPATHDKVIEELAGTGGRILESSLSHEDEEKLRLALDGAHA